MIAVLILSACLGYFIAIPFASIVQSGNYRLVALLRAKRWLFASLIYTVVAFATVFPVVVFCGSILKVIIGLLLFFATGGFGYYLYRKTEIAFHFTRRLVRLLIASLLLYLLIFFPLFFTSYRLLWAVTPALMPGVLCIAKLVMDPFEKRNNARYVDRAKRMLAEMKAKKIGITGSYGKTTVKNDLDQLLSVKYDTLASPANYNTPLGVVKTLSAATGREEMLLLEMGARRRGDIRELCEIVKPEIGVITGIAPQHLETFGSEEAIMSEKNVLAEKVPSEGIVFYNLTDPKVRVLYELRTGRKIGVGYQDADYLISPPKFSDSGSSFRLTKGMISHEITLTSVGIASVVDFSLAAAVALELGVPWESVCAVARRIYPTSHRFEIVRKGDVTIIDDSYNINPIGAKTALESLSYFSGKRKIVYTSGMVELGEKEESLNRVLGEQIAEVASLAIVGEGRYGDQVSAGILGRRDMTILRVKGTEEATVLFGSVLKKGDVLLIMSDLPREYLL